MHMIVNKLKDVKNQPCNTGNCLIKEAFKTSLTVLLYDCGLIVSIAPDKEGVIEITTG